MSGLKTEILDENSNDNLCLDQYPDGSVRLICNENFIGAKNGICEFERTAHVCLTKKEMMRLISVYLKNELEWGSLLEDD